MPTSQTHGPGAPFVYLASRSPRRRQLLRQLGVRVRGGRSGRGRDCAAFRRCPCAGRATRAGEGGGRCPRRRGEARGSGDGGGYGGGDRRRDPRQTPGPGPRRGNAREALRAPSPGLERGGPCGYEVRTGSGYRRAQCASVPSMRASGASTARAGRLSTRRAPTLSRGSGRPSSRGSTAAPSGVMGLPLRETAELLREAGIDVLAAQSLPASDEHEGHIGSSILPDFRWRIAPRTCTRRAPGGTPPGPETEPRVDFPPRAEKTTVQMNAVSPKLIAIIGAALALAAVILPGQHAMLATSPICASEWRSWRAASRCSRSS